jgi:hypothetical protein
MFCTNSGPYYSSPFFDLEAGDFATESVTQTWYDSYQNAYVSAGSIPGLQTLDGSVATAAMVVNGTMRADGIGAGQTEWLSEQYHVYDFIEVRPNMCEEIGYDTTVSGPIEIKPKVTDVAATGATKISQVLGNPSSIHFVTPKDAANSQETLTATVSDIEESVFSY